MTEYTKALELEFKNHQNSKVAEKQKAYMRNKFEFYGLTAAVRRELQKPFLAKSYLPSIEERDKMVLLFWGLPQRDYQLFAQELVFKYIKQFKKQDIKLLEYMAAHKSWWDTVDFIAYKLMGAYFKAFPEQRKPYVEKWLKSDHIWLQRCALLFQLKYKTEVDTQLLSITIEALLGSKEFFINKAIGWVLREYSRTNPEWVQAFVNNTQLSVLSKKEALRLMK